MKFHNTSYKVQVILWILFGTCNWTVARKSGNRYLEHLFLKYGSQDVITFEGLEHLMFNLGIGNLEFNPEHTIDQHRPNGIKIPNIEDYNDNGDGDEGNIENRENIKIELSASEDDDDEAASVYDTEIWKGDAWQDISFINLHDPKHKHPKQNDHGQLTTKACLSPLSLLQRVLIEQKATANRRSSPKDTTTTTTKMSSHNPKKRSVAETDADPVFTSTNEELASNIIITPSMFMDLCPALLIQIDEGGCSDVVRIEMGKLEKGLIVAWIYASVSILIISLCGLVGIALVPLMKTMAYEEILRFLVAIAIGTLCGDAMMHLLPHALTPHDASISGSKTDESESVWICSCAFFSALFMYSLENLLPLLKSKSSHGHSHRHGHSHGQSPHTVNPVRPAPTEETEFAMEVNRYVDEKEQKILDDSKTIATKKSLSPVAFMVILGDGLHNLTDGMAIGAAFAVDPVTGMATALAVLCHELPHELGDFALLVQTGVSIRKAIFFNIVSSILGFIGMVIGLVLVGVNTSSVRWIYAATAGTFLYIGLADLVPEMSRSSSGGFRNIMLQILGILSGGIIMLLIGLYEDKLRILFE